MVKTKTFGFQIQYGSGAHYRIIEGRGTSEKAVAARIEKGIIGKLYNPATDKFVWLGEKVESEQNP